MLEALAARTGPAPGKRIALGERLRIGRAREAELNLDTPHVSRFHCGVFHELDRWWVRDLGSENGIRVNGEPAREVELTHGTLLEVGRGYMYEFLAHERDAPLANAEMEAQLSKGDDAWSVYADWLQEQGAPLGELRMLGPFAGDVARGELQVEWEHGLPRRLTMRSLAGDMHDWTWEHRLACLARAPLLRFVSELTFDLSSMIRSDLMGEPPVRRVVEAIGDSLPMLERLVISPSRVFRMDRLTDRYEVKLQPWQAASVTLTSLRPLCALTIEFAGSGREPREVKPGEPTPLFMLSRFELTGAANVTFNLNANGGLWQFEKALGSGLSQVNGVAIGRAFLRPGDVLEVIPGVTLTFSA